MNNEKRAYSILFIEDEKSIRENYVTYLKRYFQDVYEAEDGIKAYETYKAKRPQIIVIDINIPKLNGINLLKKIREKDHTTKAIMLTAHSDVNYLLQASELKLTKYLVKPISRSELSNALELAIHEYSQFDTVAKKILFLKDGYAWDINAQELLFESNSIILTNKEQKVLSVLFSKINNTFSYDDIIMDVWYSFDNDKIDALKTIIKNLRKKLPKDTIKNIFGIGYRIEL